MKVGAITQLIPFMRRLSPTKSKGWFLRQRLWYVNLAAFDWSFALVWGWKLFCNIFWIWWFLLTADIVQRWSPNHCFQDPKFTSSFWIQCSTVSSPSSSSLVFAYSHQLFIFASARCMFLLIHVSSFLWQSPFRFFSAWCCSCCFCRQQF